jgi:ubiquinone/menaquinone biosynthesis C-methylase UbiE
MKPPTKLGAAEWARIYDRTLEQLSATELPFRNNAERVLEHARGLARPGEIWLDVGAGSGWLTQQLALGGARVCGVDVDRGILRIAARAERVGYVAARAEQLPFADASIDGVAGASFLGCIADPEATFRELSRVLRPGGHFVASAANGASRLSRVQDWLRKSGLATSVVLGNHSSGVYRAYLPSQLRVLLARHGLHVVGTSHHNMLLTIGPLCVPPRRALRRVEALLGQTPLAAVVGRALVMVARKA